jgi:hypothetical protein
VDTLETYLPEVDGEADVTLLGHGLTFTGRVESASDSALAVRSSLGDYADHGVARVGDAAEVFWRSPDGRMGCPARVTTVQEGRFVRWELAVTGEIASGQRRDSVRAQVVLPVTVAQNGSELAGRTLDVSEGGMRLVVDGWGLPPDPGMRATVSIDLGGASVVSTAEVIRVQAHGGRWALSIRFVGLPERDGDQLRRRVFQALREERARLAD